MKILIRLILKSKVGKSVITLLIEHFAAKLIEKLNRKKIDPVAVHVLGIAINEIKNEAIDEVINEIKNT